MNSIYHTHTHLKSLICKIRTRLKLAFSYELNALGNPLLKQSNINTKKCLFCPQYRTHYHGTEPSSHGDPNPGSLLNVLETRSLQSSVPVVIKPCYNRRLFHITALVISEKSSDMMQPEASTCLDWVGFKFHTAKNNSFSSFWF